jgi:NarL family two-component system response regulator LiaR
VEVVGIAENALRAVELALFLRPDLILMDWYLRASSGVEGTREICALLPQTRVVIMSGLADSDAPAVAHAAGAIAFIA